MLRKTLPVQSGETSLLRHLRIKETKLLGNSILMGYGIICNLDNQTLLAGISIMDCGQVKPSLYLLLTPDGFICLLTLFHSTVLSQDCKVSSQDKLPHGQMTGKVHTTIGYTKDQITKLLGCCHKECGDG